MLFRSNPDCRRGEYSRHKSCRRRRRKLFRTEVEGRLWQNKKQSVNKPPQIPVKTAWVYVFNVIPGCFYLPVPYFFYKNIRKLDRTKSQINDTVELQHTKKRLSGKEPNLANAKTNCYYYHRFRMKNIRRIVLVRQREQLD